MYESQSAYSISIKQEEEISKEFMKYVHNQYQIIEDPVLSYYVNEIGHSIVKVLPPHPYQFHFYIVKDDVYNAFAGPGGHIFVHSGLFESMETEDELAGILGHEIAHVLCRHISDMIDRSKTIGIGTLAGIAAGIFLGLSGAPTAATALTIGSMAAGQSLQLAYTRENEIQADQSGLKYLNKAGYSSAGLLKMLKKIRNKQWYGPKEIPTYLNTHPATEDRIVFINTWLSNYEKVNLLEPILLSDAFDMSKTRLTCMYADETQVIKQFELKTNEVKNNPINYYGYGLILNRIGKYPESIQTLQKALQLKPNDPFITINLADTLYNYGQYQEASKFIQGITTLPSPLNLDLKLIQGRCLIELGNYKESSDIFSEIIRSRPEYTQAYYYLAQSYEKQKNQGLTHYNLGIYYKQKDQLKNAMFHLSRAEKKVQDKEILENINEMQKEIIKTINEDEMNSLNTKERLNMPK